MSGQLDGAQLIQDSLLGARSFRSPRGGAQHNDDHHNCYENGHSDNGHQQVDDQFLLVVSGLVDCWRLISVAAAVHERLQSSDALTDETVLDEHIEQACLRGYGAQFHLLLLVEVFETFDNRPATTTIIVIYIVLLLQFR